MRGGANIDAAAFPPCMKTAKVLHGIHGVDASSADANAHNAHNGEARRETLAGMQALFAKPKTGTLGAL